MNKKLVKNKIKKISLNIFLVLLILGIAYVPGLPFTEENTAYALATNTGDGLLFYAAASNTTPQFRQYFNYNQFGSNSGTVAGAQPVITVLKTSPTKQEAIGAYQDTSGNLRVMCYDGTTWTEDWTVAVAAAGTPTTRAFDVAYETTTGDVTVAYSRNTAATNALAYRTKAGSTGCGTANWAGAANFPTATAVTSATVKWVKAARNGVSGSNLQAWLWLDNAATNADLGGAIWDGSAFTNFKSIETSMEHLAAVGDSDNFDVQYESLSGDLMTVWGNSLGANGTNGAKYMVCTGGTSACTWGAATAIPSLLDDATNLDLSSDPLTDKMAFASIGNAGSDLQGAYWSGTTWTGYPNLDTATEIPTAGTKLVTTGWLTNNGNTKWYISFDDSTGTGLSWFLGVPGSTPTAQSDYTSTPAINDIRSRYDTDINPFDNSILLQTLSDSTNGIFVFKLTMDSSGVVTWSDLLGTPTSQGTKPSTPQQGFSFQYWRYIPTTVTLGGGNNPPATTNEIAPGSSALLDGFSLKTNTGTDTATGLTVTLAPANIYQSIDSISIRNNADDTTYCSASSLVSNTVNLTSCGIPINSSTINFWVKMTAKSQSTIGTSTELLTATGTVTSITTTNSYSGTDTVSGTSVIIDNVAPLAPTSGTVTPGDTQNSLSWTDVMEYGFTDLAQTVRDYRNLAINYSTGDVYVAVYNDNIYKQTGGTGNFVSMAQTTRSWSGIAVDSTNNNVYASTLAGGDIYKQTGGSGSFTALVTGLNAHDVAVDEANKDVFSVNFGTSIYKQTAGSGSFNPTVITTASLTQVDVNPTNKDVYAGAVNTGSELYKQTGGTGSFVAFATRFNGVTGIAIDKNNNDAFFFYSGSLYKVINGTGQPVQQNYFGLFGSGLDINPITKKMYFASGDDKIYESYKTNTNVVLRRAGAAVTDVPVDGTTYATSTAIGSSVVACVGSQTSCNDTGLSNGTAYHYKIFTMDKYGNYSETGLVPTGSPATPVGAASAPTVTTQSASSITATAATLNGNITATGGASITTRGFAYGTSATLGGGDTATTTENGTFGTGAYTYGVVSLTCNTTYYSRAYATNPTGTGYGAISSSFTTGACPTTTLGDDTDGGNSTIAPGASATEIDRFSLVTNTGTDTVTGLTVTLGPASAFNNIALVDITNEQGVSRCSATPSSNTVLLTSCGIAISTSATTSLIKITPKTHANMAAPASGASYATVATVTSITATNITAGTDTDSATITVDNLSPGNITGAAVSAGDTQNGLAWSNPGDADFQSTVILRNTSLITDVPTEGILPSAGGFVGTSYVPVVSNGGTSFTDTGLTNGVPYYYKLFAYDTNGNYSTTGVVPTGSPATPATVPTVTTQSASTVGQTSATLNGNITATGGANATVRGFAWGTGATLSGGDTATTTENGSFSTGAFTNSSLTLVCNTTYYSRAYATNSAGTSFGAISASFTTTACSGALSQLHFRWRNDFGTESSSGYAAAEDTAITSGVETGDRIRLRFLINDTSGSANSYNYRLETASSSCTTWMQVASSNTNNPHWIIDTSSQVADGEVTTDSSGLSNPAGSFVSGYVMTQDSQTPALSLTSGQFTELEYSIRSTLNISTNTVYCFRLTNAGVTTGFTFSAQPQITIPTFAALRRQSGGAGNAGGEGNGSGPIIPGGTTGGGGSTEGSGQGGGSSGGGSGGGGGGVGLLWLPKFFQLAQNLFVISNDLFSYVNFLKLK